MDTLPPFHQGFNIQFASGHIAKAVLVNPEDDPLVAYHLLGFRHAYPVIFVSGGASHMEEKDRRLIDTMMEAVAQFAQERGAIVIDGGTEAGIMELIGSTRAKGKYTFPLIGVSPIGKVAYPGYDNPEKEAMLQDDHTHFILVNAHEWGGETEMIIHLAHTVCGDGKLASVGVLVNGGKIALHEVYLGSATEHKLPFIVLEGSGRVADEISTAFRTGKSTQRVLQAILKGGDIRLVATVEGADAMRQRLTEIFARKPVKKK